MVDESSKKERKTITPSLYNPHNYRLYFKFTKEKYNPKEGMVRVWSGKFKNYGKEFTALGEGVRVTVKKTQVEVINKLSEQQWFLINRENAKKEEGSLLSKIDSKCIDSLKKFIKVYGGKSDFVILKREGRPSLNLFTKCDNKVKNEPFIDTLPSEMTFETDVVKKVYKHPGEVEFKTPIYSAQYLENSALNEFAPEIVNELKDMKSVFKEVKEVMELEIENKKLHQSVLNNMKTTLKDISYSLKIKPHQKSQKEPIKTKITHYKHKIIESITLCGRYIPYFGKILITENKNQVNCKMCITRLRLQKNS